MRASDRSCVETVGAWLGLEWSTAQLDRLASYGEWLGDEGMTLGGLGPREASRLWTRHICDSLLFGRGLSEAATLLDVGSGVGLPGIPLAIAFPHLATTLLDRSRRRTDALYRVAAMLDIHPTIVHGDVAHYNQRTSHLVFRASLRLEDAARAAQRLLEPSGAAWFGLGRGVSSPALAAWRSQRTSLTSERLHIEEVGIPDGILDSPVWLLRMTLA